MALHNLPEWFMSQQADFPASGRALFVNGIGFLLAWGTTVPSDGATGYGKGCHFHHTDAALATDVMYVNNGSTTSAAFVTFATTLTNAQASDITANKSNIVTLNSDLIVALDTGASASTLDKATSTLNTVKSNVTAGASNITTVASDVVTLESDLVRGLGKGLSASASTLVATTSQLLANVTSNIGVTESNIAAKFGTGIKASDSTIAAVGSQTVVTTSDLNSLQSQLVAKITGATSSNYDDSFSTINVGLSDLRILNTQLKSKIVGATTSDYDDIFSTIEVGLSDVRAIVTALNGQVRGATSSDVEDAVSSLQVGLSDADVGTSHVATAISDMAIAQEAGTWASVSDIKVTISEMTTAFSNALI